MNTFDTNNAPRKGTTNAITTAKTNLQQNIKKTNKNKNKYKTKDKNKLKNAPCKGLTNTITTAKTNLQQNIKKTNKNKNKYKTKDKNKLKNGHRLPTTEDKAYNDASKSFDTNPTLVNHSSDKDLSIYIGTCSAPTITNEQILNRIGLATHNNVPCHIPRYVNRSEKMTNGIQGANQCHYNMAKEFLRNNKTKRKGVFNNKDKWNGYQSSDDIYMVLEEGARMTEMFDWNVIVRAKWYLKEHPEVEYISLCRQPLPFWMPYGNVDGVNSNIIIKPYSSMEYAQAYLANDRFARRQLKRSRDSMETEPFDEWAAWTAKVVTHVAYPAPFRRENASHPSTATPSANQPLGKLFRNVTMSPKMYTLIEMSRVHPLKCLLISAIGVKSVYMMTAPLWKGKRVI